MIPKIGNENISNVGKKIDQVVRLCLIFISSTNEILNKYN
jgi:hypothetical protein